MKKTLLIFIVFLFYETAKAQHDAIGLRFGANISDMAINFVGKAVADNSHEDKVGITAGIATELKLIKGLSICPELHYSQQGFSVPSTSLSNPTGGTFSINYINVPILLRGSFGSKDVRFYVNAGPQWGFYASGSETLNLSQSSSSTTSITIPADAITNDFYAVVGMGFGVTAGNGEFFLDFRYAAGLNNVADSKQTASTSSTPKSNPFDIRNKVLSFSLGYYFYLKPKEVPVAK